ncbi:tastin isoform X2 [Hyperolius riggenbachi]|uniref:tastin isoform X2 n=1 Tax=Hyperolius riggenbachi TaxID=752182 RepID=UPI0035A351B0
MQSYSDAPMEEGKMLTVVERSRKTKGNENSLPPQACLMQNKSNQKTLLIGPQKSRLPVLSKAKPPPNFQKMHQTWQTHFQKGKAVSKRSCTRPQPFNFSQKVERPRVQMITEVEAAGALTTGQPTCKSREPLAEVVLHQNNKESEVQEKKGGGELEFKADPAALASILSNIGVPIAPAGKVSLAQRVPVRAASIAPPLSNSRNAMLRSSMYTMPNSHIAPYNLDRISCIPKLTAEGQKPLLRHHTLKNTTVKEPAAVKKVELHLQENPVSKQMNPPSHVPVPAKPFTLLPAKEIHETKLTPPPMITDSEATAVSTAKCDNSPAEINRPTDKEDSSKNTDPSPEVFVPASKAIATILSNTDTIIACSRKLSLAQRVPMQGRHSMLKSAKASSGTSLVQTASPKLAQCSMSNVPIKDLIFSPCRVPDTSAARSLDGSARRVLQTKPSTVSYFQPSCSSSKPPVFPKTPRALALEMANKRFEMDYTCVQSSSQSAVKWADEHTPTTALCENEPEMERVAVRLFLDGDCPRDSDKEKESTAVSNLQRVLESPSIQQKEAELPENSVNKDGQLQDLQLHENVQPPPSSQPSEPSTSSDPCIRPSVPLSFLAHPAVQALQSSTLGSCSLPDIARLRLQATVSAKQKFLEARLDKECAFYTSLGAVGSIRSCEDPVSSFLERQEDMHFAPIHPES